MIKKIFYFSLLILFFFQLVFIDNYHNWGDDFSLYLHQAKSLVEGSSSELHLINLDMMKHGKIGPALYPMGFPLLISPLQKLGCDLYFFKVVEIIFYILSLIILQKIYSKYLSEVESITLSLFYGIQKFYFFHTNNILSDIPAVFFALVVLYLYLNFDSASKNRFLFILKYILASLFLMCTRTNYLFLFFGFILIDSTKLFSHNRNNKILYLNLAILFSFIILNTFVLVSDGKLESHEIKKLFYHPADLLSIFHSNINYYIKLISYDTLKSKHNITNLFVLFLVLLYVLYKKINSFEGFKYLLVYLRSEMVTLLILNFSVLSIYLIWPYTQGHRFVFFNLAFVPFFSYKFLKKILLKKYFEIFCKSIALSSLVLWFFSFTFHQKQKNLLIYKDIPNSSNFNKCMNFIKTHTFPTDVILCNKPRVLHYFGDRRSYVIYNNINVGVSNPYSYVFTITTEEFESVSKEVEINRNLNLKVLFEKGELKIIKITQRKL